MEASGQIYVQNILEIEIIGYVDALDVGIKEREELRMIPRFWLKQWMNSDVISWGGEVRGGTDEWVERIKYLLAHS